MSIVSGCSLVSEPRPSTSSADKTISATGSSSDKQQHGRARHATTAAAASSLSDTHLRHSDGGGAGGGDAARLSLNENELAHNKSRRLGAAAGGSADKTISAADDEVRIYIKC